MIAFTGILCGYDGTFSFEKIGLEYPSNVNYLALRFLPCLLGSLVIPITYATMRNHSHSTAISILTSLFILFENATVTQSRLILLDSFLLFFTALTALTWSEFQRYRTTPFSTHWWRTLTFVGISLGLTVSVKWVGLFTITWIGIITITELWNFVTNPTIPLPTFYRHFTARVVTLIIVPITVYLSFFYIHFSVLSSTGPGASFMPAEFQATLRGTPLVSTYQDVAFGSTIVIRHSATAGGYLHSHPHNYPTGSKQQQMTCYPHKDANSDFLILYPLTFVNSTPVAKPIEGFQRLKDGDTIRLEHVPTVKRIHSHDVRPGWNDDKEINEVSAYGTEGVLGDANDHWIVQIPHLRGDGHVKALETSFRLKHALTGCYLYSRVFKLPEWGFGQQEVTCSTKARYDLTLWNIEYTTHPDSIYE
jgi:dolichyl-phosphate-mannose-protein mannosyltransferase